MQDVQDKLGNKKIRLKGITLLVRELGCNVKLNQSSISGQLKPEIGANGELG
jgi:hypothetical protein